MPPRLLIINCSSPYFFYIPMGTFGLCDYLNQRGFTSCIFNPALYPAGEVEERLLAALTTFKPTHVGLVLHWQETVHGLLTAVKTVRTWNPETVTFCGGFTASYFAEDLLATVDGLDYVVVGDPEEPVGQLLLGYPPDGVANLVWRDGPTIRRSAACWLMDARLLDSLSFAGLSFLLDADRYIEKINTKLGFPVFLGRGCVFDCEYCGGSRHAFRLHSGRHKPVTRSIAAILADLHVLKERATILYICYENDLAFVKALFRAIAGDPELRGHFTLHYGAWHLLDEEFLALYQAAFDCTGRPVFEFSPEVFADVQRAAIKRGVTYTMRQLRENITAIGRAFSDRVRIEVFFSRYHPLISPSALEEEIRAIFFFSHQMFLDNAPVHVCFDHLSTDVGSRYWEQHIKQPRLFSTLLQLKEGVDQRTSYPFPVDNLCLFIPEHLSPDFRVRCEALLFVLEKLERFCTELFHILFACQGDRWLAELAVVLMPFLETEALGRFFTAPPLDAILEGLGLRLTHGSLAASLPFMADLLRFSRRKLELASCLAAPAESPPEDGYFVLTRERVAIHEHDYLDLRPFIARLQQRAAAPLAYQRTVFFFLRQAIVAVPHAFYRSTFRYFEQPRTLADYRAFLSGQKGIDRAQHDQLQNRLLADGLLVPVEPG